MLFSDPRQDRYSQFTYNPNTDQYDRDWIRYADGVFEPIRRDGNISAKWNGERTNFKWWATTKPADWRPWDEGFGFSWNHDLGEEHKPAGWGDKPEREIEAGNTPYFLNLDLNEDRRIESRTEKINGRRETWRYLYDSEGRLSECISNTGWAQAFSYDEKGRRISDEAVGRDPFIRKFIYGVDDRLLSVGDTSYEHDENGFRSARTDEHGTTRYAYSEDYRLLGAKLPDGREITYEHDEDGQRALKLINGEPVEAYEWLDFIRLGGFFDGRREFVFKYKPEERLPYSMTVSGVDFTLKYDQVGSLKAVVADDETVVKMIQYTPFGTVLWDSNPDLRIPLGFAGGLHDPDTGLTRFGWRDYDPDTARWTASDPIGDEGGDDDWYGYCLDDPVNGIDPHGLSMYGWAATIGGPIGRQFARHAARVDARYAAKGYPTRKDRETTSLYSSMQAEKEKAAAAQATADTQSAANAKSRAEADAASKAEEETTAQADKAAAAQAMAEKKDEKLGVLAKDSEDQKAEPLGGARQALGNPSGDKTVAGTTQRTVDLAKGKKIGGLTNPGADLDQMKTLEANYERGKRSRARSGLGDDVGKPNDVTSLKAAEKRQNSVDQKPSTDPIGRFTFAKRPLDGPAKGLFGQGAIGLLAKGLMRSPFSFPAGVLLASRSKELDDRYNTEFAHEHGFWGDNPRKRIGKKGSESIKNIGFMEDKGLNLYKEENKRTEYVFENKSYDGPTMVKALKNIKGGYSPKNYNLPSTIFKEKKNCQDSMAHLRREGIRIWHKENLEKGEEWFGK